MSGPAVDGVRMVMDGVWVVMDGVRVAMGRPRAGHARPLQGGNFCSGRLRGCGRYWEGPSKPLRPCFARPAPLKGAPFCAGFARGKASPFRTDSPDTGEVARSARRGAVAEQSDGRKGSRPFAAAAHFHHSAGASVASGTGVSSGWGAFASRYA